MKLFKRLFLFFSAVLFALSLSRHMDPPVSSPLRGTDTAAVCTGGYDVRSEGNRIRVQPLSGGQPRYVEGVLVTDLPEADRLQLAEGFSVPDDAALLALLEDYTG